MFSYAKKYYHIINIYNIILYIIITIIYNITLYIIVPGGKQV